MLREEHEKGVGKPDFEVGKSRHSDIKEVEDESVERFLGDSEKGSGPGGSALALWMLKMTR